MYNIHDRMNGVSTKYIIGDIHTVIKSFDENTFSLIYTNPPFNTTKKKWDTPLDWVILFKEMDRVLKPNGVILIFFKQKNNH